ncbi:hypothetical protein UNSWDHB_2255 [Dehalobacter sp. UNSWDHB]|uniref:hypothetical protein n=1 Tax=Dehalobacter sp. UNSWDHB TaxID=1339256 RepID=UPI0003879C00|nr:hypothetical protein [Dehalobacter sp. UNSWDHB]EQB20427.1 hypothetical protein UNSWDHB_2255 [Dehalobacter sp. UNSWDHB]
MEKEINAGYTITDRLSVGNAEFVIGQSESAPAKFVTWKVKKDGKDYYWGHYSNDRLMALEDLCNRALDEVHYLKSLREEQNVGENPTRQNGKKKSVPER